MLHPCKMRGTDIIQYSCLPVTAGFLFVRVALCYQLPLHFENNGTQPCQMFMRIFNSQVQFIFPVTGFSRTPRDVGLGTQSVNPCLGSNNEWRDRVIKRECMQCHKENRH